MKPRLRALLGVVLLTAGRVYAADPLSAAGKAVAAGDYSTALTELKQLHGSQADAVTARFLRGTALAGAGRLEQAAAVFRKLIADHPRLPEPYNNLAAVYVRQGQLAKAKDILERGLRTDDRYAALYHNLSDIYLRMASASYAKALRIKPANPPPALQVLTSLKSAPGLPAPIAVASAESDQAAPARHATPSLTNQPKSSPTSSPVPAVAKVAPVPQPASKPAPVAPKATTIASARPTPKPAPKPAPAPIPAKAAPVSQPAPKPASPPVVAHKPVPATPAAAPSTVLSPKVRVVAANSMPAKEKTVVSARQTVIDTLDGWAVAWSQQNVSSYLDYYISDYAPPGSSHSAWAAERRERLTRPAWIKVSLADIQVTVKTPTQAVATLVQHYTASDYRDVTHKRFTLVMRDGNWMITSEQSFKVLH